MVVDKIYFRSQNNYQKMYKGNELLYEVGQSGLDYLTFTAVGAGATVKYNATENTTAEYSLDGGSTWTDAVGVTITLANVGDSVKYRGVISGNISNTGLARFTFSSTSTKTVAASGSIMSMYNNNPNDTVIAYTGAFRNMFLNRRTLISAPELPATTLADNCYESMFSGCNRLVEAPDLPATTLANACYEQMFYNCTSLTTAPELPATTLTQYCYYYMFYGCTSLTSVTHHITDWNTFDTSNWLSTVAASGTVYCPTASTIPSDSNSGIPTGWTRVNF